METVLDIWDDLGSRLRRFVGSKVSDPHVADDITQDVLLKVQSQMDSLPPEEKLPGWVFTIARNAVIDYYRARAVRDHANIDDVEPPAIMTEAETNVAVREFTPCLVRMVERLPEPYREAMKLVDFEGLNQRQLADRIDISLSGAKSRVQRARQQLREMIEDCCRIERDSLGNLMDFDTTERSSRYCGGEDGKAQCGQ